MASSRLRTSVGVASGVIGDETIGQDVGTFGPWCRSWAGHKLDAVRRQKGIDMAASKVLVGVDFSPHGEAALGWAAAHAQAFGWQLEVVHAWSYPWWAVAPVGSAGEEARDEVISSAERHLRAFVEEHLPEGSADPTLTVVEGDPAEMLVEAADDAVAIVIGSGGRRALNAWLTGAVGRRLAASSPVPVIVVPDDYQAGSGPVVVGVDGSPNSIRALEWACQHADQGREVRAVTTWTSNAAHLAGVVAVDLDLMENSAHSQLSSTLEQAAEDGIDVSGVQQAVVYGDPRSVLRDLEGEAEMLVLGSRGASGLAGVLVGSVTSTLVHRPGCPLVVVPADED
jgi:nucleotide-binding universal stress UspA family protein